MPHFKTRLLLLPLGLACACVQVQAVITIEYLVLMTVTEGQTTRTVESKVDGWILSEDLVTGPSPGGGPHVKVFNGVNSTQLIELACSDAEVSEATVITTIRDDQVPDGETHFLIILKPVYVSSYQSSGSAGDVPPVEELTLNFEEVEVIHRRKLPTGETQESSSGVQFCLGDGSVRGVN